MDERMYKWMDRKLFALWQCQSQAS